MGRKYDPWWKVRNDKIEKYEGMIEELKEEIRAEQEKIPNMEEWEEMSYEDKREWTKHASDEQLNKIQHDGLDF